MALFSGPSKSSDSAESRKLHASYGQLLCDGEIIEVGFSLIRDTLLFTNKRLIIVEKQGLSGRQIEYISIPYGKINKFSVQTGEPFDLNAELKLWLASDALPLEKKFNQDVNVYDVHKVLSSHVLK